MEQEALAALDNLVEELEKEMTAYHIQWGVKLHQAVIRSLDIIDRAVKEGRYASAR